MKEIWPNTFFDRVSSWTEAAKRLFNAVFSSFPGYVNTVQLSGSGLSLNCRVLPRSPSSFHLGKWVLVIGCMLRVSQIAKCCFLQLIVARRLKLERLLWQEHRTKHWTYFVFIGCRLGDGCPEVLPGYFLLSHGNLWKLEERSDLMWRLRNIVQEV